MASFSSMYIYIYFSNMRFPKKIKLKFTPQLKLPFHFLLFKWLKKKYSVGNFASHKMVEKTNKQLTISVFSLLSILTLPQGPRSLSHSKKWAAKYRHPISVLSEQINSFASFLTVNDFFKFINGFWLPYLVHLSKSQKDCLLMQKNCHHLSRSSMQDPIQVAGIQNSFSYLSTSSNPHHFLITHESIFFPSQLFNFLFFCSYLIPILF